MATNTYVPSSYTVDLYQNSRAFTILIHVMSRPNNTRKCISKHDSTRHDAGICEGNFPFLDHHFRGSGACMKQSAIDGAHYVDVVSDKSAKLL